jgi:hypothetical protein
MVPEPVAYYLPSLFVCGAVGLALQPINRRQQSNDLLLVQLPAFSRPSHLANGFCQPPRPVGARGG